MTIEKQRNKRQSMNAEVTSVNREKQVKVLSGWVMLPIVLILLIGGPAVFIYSIAAGADTIGHPIVWLLVLGILMVIIGIICCVGLFTLQPNEARVLLLFGEYKGTVRASGFWWGNPFYSNGNRQGLITVQMAQMEGKLAAAQGGRQSGPRGGSAKPPSRHKISLRARTLNGEKLKVNDKRGNPIEIAAIVIWRVQDTAQAAFDVDDYEKYVETQSESALRHLASCYSYDHGEENEITLRSGVEEVSQALRKELQDRLAKAGVTVEEARLTHLAYAPEIAQAMLRRQQAEAVIAARQKIVHGAVSMVEMALRELAEKQVVQLDDERKAAMVSNLMVVLCGESEVHPVLNTGTLYT
jgi:regulator of protease activity HflC (stomatin/prohibitin superfamily)